MSAAAQTPGLTDPFTGKDRLLAVARWLVCLILLRWLILRGQKLVATLHHRIAAPDLARIDRGLRRAIALHAEMLAIRPTEGELDDIGRRRAIAAVIIEICTDLGVFRARPGSATAKNARRRVQSRSYPQTPHLARPAAEVAFVANSDAARARDGPHTRKPRNSDARSTRVYPWSFSRCAPASFSY